MKQRLGELSGVAIDDEAGDVAEMSSSEADEEEDDEEESSPA